MDNLTIHQQLELFGIDEMRQLTTAGAERQRLSGSTCRHMGPLRSLSDEHAPLLARLVIAIAELPEGGFMSAVDVLWSCLDDDKPSLAPELTACGRTLLLHWVPEKGHRDWLDYQLGKLIMACLPGPDGVEAARAVADQLVNALADYRIWSGEYPQTQKALLIVQPMVLLDTLLLSETLQKKWVFEADDDSFLSRLPDAPLLAWADRDPANRYPRVAAVARLFTPEGTPAPIMLHLIDHALDRQAVLDAINGNLGPSGGMVDEVAALYAARTKGITLLFSHADQAVVTWAKAIHVKLQKQAEFWAQDRHCRDERFE